MHMAVEIWKDTFFVEFEWKSLEHFCAVLQTGFRSE